MSGQAGGQQVPRARAIKIRSFTSTCAGSRSRYEAIPRRGRLVARLLGPPQTQRDPLGMTRTRRSPLMNACATHE
jgi:hypothetical protein